MSKAMPRVKGRPTPAELGFPDVCPQCNAALSLGLREVHSFGPGRTGRCLRWLAFPLGLLTAYGLGMVPSSWGGGVVSAFVAIVVITVVYRVAAAFPKSRRIWCRSCKWSLEVPCDNDGRPLAEG